MDSQAAYRLAQSRLQLGVDQQPHEGVRRFSQCLLAELETLSLLSTTPSTSSTPARVKQLEAQTKAPGAANGVGDKDKGKGASTVNLPCRYFRSDSGCKAGKNCKWSHAWNGIDDKAQRCWICGAKDHRKSDCKLKAQTKGSPSKDTKGTGEPSGGSRGGKSSSFNVAASTSYNTGGKQFTSSGTNSTSTPAKLQEMEGPCSGGGAAGPGVDSKGGDWGNIW